MNRAQCFLLFVVVMFCIVSESSAYYGGYGYRPYYGYRRYGYGGYGYRGGYNPMQGALQGAMMGAMMGAMVG